VSEIPSAFAPFRGVDVVRVLEEDPALGDGLDPASLEQASRVIARTLQLPAGEWEVPAPSDPAGLLGLLVLDGLLVRSVAVGEVSFFELLGAGDILRPWTYERDVGVASIPAGAHWRVAQPSRVALLDRRFALGTARWPEIQAALLDRAVTRARRAAFNVSVCGIVQLDVRLLVMMWHLADRWGRVTADGVLVPLRLSHELLAGVVGARRPSVTVALGRLREDGTLLRRPDGTWLLVGDPPDELGRLRRGSALAPGLGMS
jgi:CRP/FNR family transcriptional regulator, cyclic AMP receptor protein